MKTNNTNLSDGIITEVNPIDLHTFRRINNITQEELAVFLGVSRGFISSIELEKAKLPEDKLILLQTKAKEEMGWDIDDLMPARKRILTLMDSERSRLVWKGTSNAKFYSIHQLLGVPEKVVVNILKGKASLTKTIIELIHTQIPDVNINWLLTGEGDVYLNENPCLKPEVPTIQEVFAKLHEINKVLTEIRAILDQIKGNICF